MDTITSPFHSLVVSFKASMFSVQLCIVQCAQMERMKESLNIEQEERQKCGIYKRIRAYPHKAVPLAGGKVQGSVGVGHQLYIDRKRERRGRETEM